MYERKLRQRPIGWGLNNNTFFYQESNLEDDLFEIY